MNGYEEIKDPLEKFGRDITESYKDNKIDPVIGRDEEIRNLIRILSRKTKNNPVLIGELVLVRPRLLKDLLVVLSVAMFLTL